MFSALYRLVEAFGQSSINVYEWERAVIVHRRLAPNQQISDVTTARPSLNFTGWNLAHSVVKADFLSPTNLVLPGLGFLLQMNEIVDFSHQSNFRLAYGGSQALADFSQTSVTGRIGQGLSMLLAQRLGYCFVSHLASDPEVVALMTSSSPQKAADFLFETSSGDRMIFESKASATLTDNHPSKIKSVLKSALLDQVEPWMSQLTPAPQKGYAAYSCMREVGAKNPSAIFYVDPDQQEPSEPMGLPLDWVRRRNYAAWLKFMGLSISSKVLMQLTALEPQEVRLPVAQIAGRNFAFVPDIVTYDCKDAVCIGIEVEALQAISEAIYANSEHLTSYQGIPHDELLSLDRQNGSVLTDGTFLGSINAFDTLLGEKTFRL